jgi:hydroxymethylbilane synthase
LLALAGLKRLGLADAATATLDVGEFVPAVGQGIIAIETRDNDATTRTLLCAINDRDSMTALVAERAFLAVLDGSCRTPIGGHAVVTNDRIKFHGLIARPDGSACLDAARDGSASDAVALGADAGHELKQRAGADFFSTG